MSNTSAPHFCDSVASSGNDCDRVARYAIEADGSTTYACAYHWERALAELRLDYDEARAMKIEQCSADNCDAPATCWGDNEPFCGFHMEHGAESIKPAYVNPRVEARMLAIRKAHQSGHHGLGFERGVCALCDFGPGSN